MVPFDSAYNSDHFPVIIFFAALFFYKQQRPKQY